MRRKLFFLISFVLVLALVGNASVANILWDDGEPADHYWDSPANWQGDVLPAEDDAAFVCAPQATVPKGPILRAGVTAPITGDFTHVVVGNTTVGTANMTMTGGTLNVKRPATAYEGYLLIGWNEPAEGHFMMSGGTVNVMTVGVGTHSGTGTFTMTGGTVNNNDAPDDFILIPWVADPGNPGSGHVNLYGGTYFANNFIMSETGSVDITKGTLILNGDQRAIINQYISNNWITAYHECGTVVIDYNVTNRGKTTVTASLLSHDVITYPGWDIFQPTGSWGYRYGPSIIINSDSSIDMWCASPGGPGEADWIRHKKSTDGGHTWGPETVVLRPTPGSIDAWAVCDPGVIKFGGYYYIGYTATMGTTTGYDNSVFVARSTSPTSGFEKWNGSGWGGNPQPFIDYTGPSTDWGAGEPSFVLKDGTLYIYYTWSSTFYGLNQTRVSTAPASDLNWPGNVTYCGVALNRFAGEDSTDVKYLDEWGKFIGIATASRFTADSYIHAWESMDGLIFSSVDEVTENLQAWAHNAGISGTAEGHIDLNDDNFVAYAYSKYGGISWGYWHTHLNPICISGMPFADYNFDNIIDFIDYADFANDWLWSGQAGGYNNSDLNCDGLINPEDLLIFAQQWLNSCL